MKKLLLLFSLSFLFSACDPDYNEGLWYVKNSTDQTLNLVLSVDGKNKSENKIVVPGDSARIWSSLFFIRKSENSTPYFEDWLEESSTQSKYDVLEVFSEDDVLLQKWSYKDADLPDRRLFEESAWNYYERYGGGRPALMAIWVFEIQPEDIVQTEP